MDKEKPYELKKESGEIFLKVVDSGVNPHVILDALRSSGTAVSLDHIEEVISKEPGQWVSMSKKAVPMVQVRIAPDRMRADIFLNIAEGDKEPTIKELREALTDKGVIYGLDEELLERIPKEGVSLSGEWKEIAKGRPPQDGIDAVLKVMINTERKGPADSDEAAQVDLKALGVINSVRRDQVIAVKTPLQEGIDGTNVTGGAVKARQGKDLALKAGPNTILSEDGLTLRAASGGHLIRDGSKFSVERVFQVKGDVDYGTGNLECYGSISVSGSIREDFSVNALEDINIRGVVEGAHLNCGGNITLGSSVRGMGKGLIECGGDLHAEYMDQCTIKVGGNLFFRRALMHCEVETEGAVRFQQGGKGLIAGGTVRAGSEIECTILGTKMGTKTHIHVGLSPKLMDQRKELVAKKRNLSEKKITLEKNILYLSRMLQQKGLSQNQKALVTKYLELCPVLDKQLAKIESLEHDMDKLIDRAKLRGSVKVRGLCYPGVYITIRQETLRIMEPLQEVRFIYRDGKVRVEPLEE